MVSKLTPKQRQFFKHYCKTHSLIEAAKYVKSKCKDNNGLSSEGYRILRSLDLSMGELLDAQGITDAAMSKPLQDGLNAKKPLVATWEGKITDQLWIEDQPTRAKFLEMYHRLKGNFVDRHELSGKDGGDIILQVKPASKVKSGVKIKLDESG